MKPCLKLSPEIPGCSLEAAHGEVHSSYALSTEELCSESPVHSSSKGAATLWKEYEQLESSAWLHLGNHRPFSSFGIPPCLLLPPAPAPPQDLCFSATVLSSHQACLLSKTDFFLIFPTPRLACFRGTASSGWLDLVCTV